WREPARVGGFEIQGTPPPEKRPDRRGVAALPETDRPAGRPVPVRLGPDRREPEGGRRPETPETPQPHESARDGRRPDGPGPPGELAGTEPVRDPGHGPWPQGFGQPETAQGS